MERENYTITIHDLKVSGSAEAVHRLATIYSLASCEYGHQIADEIHGKHRNKLIAELMSEQKELENIERQLIDAIRNSNYYKDHSSKMSKMIDDVLDEIKNTSYSGMIDISVYADSTGLFTDEEIETENLVYLAFPSGIVRAFVGKTHPELTFKDWLDNYTADWTEGLCDFAEQRGFKVKR